MVKSRKIFRDAKIIRLKLSELDRNDRTFAVSWPSERGVETLARQIEVSGVVTPVWVLQKDKETGFRLVDGFRRAAAAEKIGLEELPAVGLSGVTGPVELFRARLAAQESRLSAVEAAKVLEKLKTRFKVRENTLIKTFLPLVGLGSAAHLLKQCLGLNDLQEPVARYCAEAQAGLAEAALWAEFPAGARQAVLVYVRALRPGGNLLRNYLVLLGEIALRRGTTVGEVLKDKVLQKILLDEQTARSIGRELMHRRLRELRYPLMKSLEDRFDAARRELGLPREILIEHPQLFEGGRLKLIFEAADPGDLAAKARLLLEAAESGRLGELFRCLGAPPAEDRETGGEPG